MWIQCKKCNAMVDMSSESIIALQEKWCVLDEDIIKHDLAIIVNHCDKCRTEFDNKLVPVFVKLKSVTPVNKTNIKTH